MEIGYALPRIAPETVDSYAFTNRALLRDVPKAFALIFHGLGGGLSIRTEHNDFEARCAAEGVLTVFPYYGPWSWMNMNSVRYVDDVLAALRAVWGLPESLPVVSTGHSMGGLSALMYTKLARITPVGCCANCPVCDLPLHAGERPDLPRTIYLAFNDYERGLEAALRMHSPVHQAARMPRVPYYIVHGDADAAVNKALHSDRFVAAMREAGHAVEYHEVPGMAHCDLGAFPEEKTAYEDAALAFCR